GPGKANSATGRSWAGTAKAYRPGVALAGQGGRVRAPAGLLGVTGELDPAAGPLQRGPRVGFGQVGGGLREDTGQHAAADVARRVDAEGAGLGDVVAVQQGLVAAHPGEAPRVSHPGRMVSPDVRAGRAHHGR